MKYYKIDPSVESKIHGRFPQTGIDKEYDYGNALEQERRFGIYYDLFLDDKEAFIHLMLYKSSKITDILSNWNITAHGFLVNQRVKTILKEAKLCDHRFYNIELRREGGQKLLDNYFWLHLSHSNLYTQVDYSKSTFYITESTVRQDDIKLSSFQDYQNFIEEKGLGWGIFADEIHFKEDFDFSYDMFVIHFFDRDIYISDKLKKKLESEKVTGYSLWEANNIHSYQVFS